MKKIFTLFAAAAMALTASAQNEYKASGENVAAGTTLVDNADLSVKTVYSAKGGVEAQNICGVEFTGWFQLRVASDPNADNVTGGEQSDSTPLVVEAKKTVDFSIYTRRQKGSDGYNVGDNKDILATNQNGIVAVAGTLTIDPNTDTDGSYGYVKNTFHFEPGTYTLYRRGSTMRVFGFTWAAGTSAITDIAADENAPVEYFNLQGIRVDNPTSGLYIKRQGSKVTKVIM